MNLRRLPLLALFAAACTTTAHPPAAAPGAYTVLESPPRAPTPLLDWHQTPEGLTKQIDEAMAASDAALAKVAALPAKERTFANTPEAIELAGSQFIDTAQRLQIWKDVHPDPKVRAAAAEAEEKSGQYVVKLNARRDLYLAVKQWADGPGKDEKLDPQQARLVEIMMRDFKRNGLMLDDAKLAELVAIRQKLTTLGTEFSKNLNENLSTIEVTEAELAGMPASWVAHLKKTADGSKYVVTTKYPDYFPFMENAKSGDARRRMYLAFNTREASTNLPLLQEAVKLRDEAAKLLGYPTHADYVTEDRMAKNAATVKDFLDGLRGKLKVRRDADYARMTELKRAETGDKDAKLESWDFNYYLNQWKKKDYALDDEVIRDYFPAERVVSGMFGVYEELFGLKIEPIAKADLWHPDVRAFEIKDASTGQTMAYFYADLFPREGKYGHAACAPVNVPRVVDGQYVAPVSVLMANFTPPSNGRPSLMTHSEVTTLFHEFGHIVHNSLTRARYGSESGFNVAGDFVEAPSQMLENWMFTPEVLDRLGGHWQDPTKKLPRETIAKIKEARTFDAGYRYTRQVFLATFDQILHTSGPNVDPARIEHEQYERIMGIKPPPEQRFSAGFGHLMGGYDAGYYGYLWSEVFAADMFTKFEQEGVLNGALGRRYRETILAKGRSVDADQLLEEFLGRKPSNAAFLSKLGIQ